MDDQQELEEQHATNAMIDVDPDATRTRRILREAKRTRIGFEGVKRIGRDPKLSLWREEWGKQELATETRTGTEELEKNRTEQELKQNINRRRRH